MKFECSYCKAKGTVKPFVEDGVIFLMKKWYRDNNGYDHEIIICKNCGSIHNLVFSFKKICKIIFGESPFEVVNVTNTQQIRELIGKLDFLNASVIQEVFGLTETTADFLIDSHKYDDIIERKNKLTGCFPDGVIYD